MPEFLDRSLLDNGAEKIFQTRLDTQARLEKELSVPNNSILPPTEFHSVFDQGKSQDQYLQNLPPNITLEDALFSNNPKLRNIASDVASQKAEKTPEYRLHLGQTLDTPSEMGQKFIDKKFGFDARINNEDFYYKNDYMADGWFTRNIIKNPARFVARVVPQAVMKLGEGLGYVGSMITSIGSDNYWADVADNGMSNWLQGLEQKYKDHVIPVYKQAGFDDKGFFSKLTDWSFWNDEIADSVAFMASAAIPGMALSKLGTIGALAGEVNAFGKEFSVASRLGKLASSVGMGSPAELTSWTFNTAMESAQEAAGVFKDSKRNMEQLRAAGVEGYANLTDEQIRSRSGSMAAATIGGNFLVLGLSNAYENTLFFKRSAMGTDVTVGKDFLGHSKAVEGLTSKNPFASSLSRTSFYGKEAFKGLMAEGVWEENAQLAIQRMNTVGPDGKQVSNETGVPGFFNQYFKQLRGAATGQDQEALESIGLGALIGIGAGTFFSKLHGERKSEIDETNRAIDTIKAARNSLFSTNDVWERDKDNRVVFEGDQPKIDPVKLSAKKDELAKNYTSVVLSNLEEYKNSKPVEFVAKQALANYVRSLANIGITGIGDRLSNLSPDNAALFGLDPKSPNEKAADYKNLAESFEQHAKDIEKIAFKDVPGVTKNRKTLMLMALKSDIYGYRTQNEILAGFVADENSKLLSSLNKSRTLDNASLAQYPVDQLNILLHKKVLTDNMMKSKEYENMSDVDKKYYQDRQSQLTTDIEDYKKNNELALKDSRQVATGYYVADDANKKLIPLSKESWTSQQSIADYENIIHANAFRSAFLSDKDKWHDNYIALSDTVQVKAFKEAMNKQQQAYEKSIFSKYDEIASGDFNKLTRVAGKIVGGETVFTDEELQLQQNYAKLLEELLPIYQTALTANTKKVISDRLQRTINRRNKLEDTIQGRNTYIQGVEDSFSSLIDDLKSGLIKDEVKIKSIQDTIYKAQDIIYKTQDLIKEDEKIIELLNNKIALLEQEVEGANIIGLKGALEEAKKEKEWAINEIEKSKGLIATITKLIKDLLKIAKKILPGGFNMKKLDKIFKDDFYGEKNRENYREDIVSAYDEINLNTEKKAQLEEYINTLEKVVEETTKVIDNYTNLLNDINNATLAEIDAQYAALTGEVKAGAVNPAESSMNDAFDSEYKDLNNPVTTEASTTEESDIATFGDYIRPLTTKFFTSTFIDARNKNREYDPSKFSPAEQDHFEMLSLLSDQKRSKEVKSKLGKGKLKVIAVTRDNAEKLGLKKLLYTKTNSDGSKEDQSAYWEDKDINQQVIAFVHVIDDNGKLSYIDKDLNRLGLITDNKIEKSNIVRTILRANDFKDSEQAEYLEKYGEDKMVTALQAGKELREDIIANSKTFDINDPNTVFDFNITRGIANKFENADGSQVKNSIVGILLDADQIDGHTVFISKSGSYALNGTEITLGKGKSFIRTKNGEGKGNLHAADNNKLEEEQVSTILNVFKRFSEDYVKNLEEVMKGMLNGQKFSTLSKREKDKVISEYNKKKVKKFNMNYLRFLNSIIYFDSLKKANNYAIHPNQVYIKGSYIYFGKGNPIDMTNAEAFLTNEDAKKFLLNQYHNVIYYSDVVKANKKYTEYYMDGTELKSRDWSTYSHYLISPKLPNGTERSYIPITTQIKTQEQSNLEGNKAYLPYISQAIILDVQFVEEVGKKEPISSKKTVDNNDDLPEDIEFTSRRSLKTGKKTQAEPVPEATPEVKKEPGKKESPLDRIRRIRDEAANKQAKEQVKEKAAAETSDTGKPESPLARIRRLRNTETIKPEEVKPVSEEEAKEDDSKDIPDMGMDVPAFRIKKEGFFKTEEDLDNTIADVERMIPQFPVIRLKKAIQTMDGREALGEFTGDVIKIWEDAEEGTLYHEAFEAVVNRILSPHEWNAISKEFKSRTGSFTDRESGETIQYSKATDFQAKEEIAEEFRTYKMTGKLPSQKNTRTFFQVILDFIKSFFTNRLSINTLFENIDKGALSERSVLSNNRFSSNYRIKKYPLPWRDYNNYLDGVTAFMFKRLFYSPDSLSHLDEVGGVDSILYEQAKADIQAAYDTLEQKLATGSLPIHPENAPNKADNEAIRLENQANLNKRAAISNAIENWNILKEKENWNEFVQYHKLDLRRYSVKFDEDYNLSNDDNEMVNRNDYLQSEFKVSVKNSASASTRFLIGTLVKANVKGTNLSLGNIIPNIVQDTSNALLPQLQNYDKMMLMVLDKLSGLNRIDRIEEKLKEISGIKDVQEASPADRNEIANSLNSEQAALSLLYVRLFAQKDVSEDAQWNMKTKFLSYTSKYSPTPHIFLLQEGESYFIESNKRPAYEGFYKKVQSSIINNVSTAFSTKYIKGVKTYISRIKDEANFNDFIGNKETKGKQKIKDFIAFLGLEKIVTAELVESLPTETRNQLAGWLLRIRNAMKGVEFTGDITLKNVNISGYFKDFIDFLDGIQPIAEKGMQYFNGENEAVQNYIPPSFIARIIGEMNNVKSLKELRESFPHLENSFSEDSIIIKRMFDKDGKRTDYKLSLDYIEGMKNGDKFRKSAKLEEHQRLGLQFLANLEGFYYSLPADSETEWVFNMGDFVDYTDDFLDVNENQIINQIMIPKLRSEIQAAMDFYQFKHLHQLNQTHEDGSIIGESLRFFRDILQYKGDGKLSMSLVDKIHKDIKELNKTPEQIISENKKKIQTAIRNYLEQKTTDTFNNLHDQRVVLGGGPADVAIYEIQHLTSNLKKKFGGDSFSLSRMRDIIAYGVVNSTIGNIEQFKVFFGDVAQYKDWEKRAKSMFGPVEQAYYDETGEFNKYLNDNKNSAFLGEESVKVAFTDVFSISYRNSLNARTINDIMVINPEVYNTLVDLKASFADSYEETNEADGQSIGTLQMAKQLMIKAGWRWTKKNEEFFQYDTALARQELSKSGRYSYNGNTELEAMDKKILLHYKDNIPVNGITPVKTLVPSIRPDGTHDLLKHSVYFISYQLAKDFELLDVYLDMLNRGDDLLNFKSAHKVGLSVDDNGEVTDHYKKTAWIDKNGNSITSINPYERTNLEEVGTPQFEISFRTLGIQVETQATKKGQTLGSQLSKDIFLNLMPNGTPDDYRNHELVEGLSEEEKVEKWANLSESERLGLSKDYRLVRDGITALENLKEKSVLDAFIRIGMKYDIDQNGKISYYPEDLPKLQKFIMDELLRLEVDMNTMDSLELTEDYSQFKNPSESLPTYNTISNVIWSLADKSISSLNVNGKSYIQVASTFFNRSPRKSAYKDVDGKWITVDNKEDFDRLQKEGKKMVLTSSELKFYTIKEEDKEISGMEILLPHIYKTKVNEKRKKRGLEPLTDDQLMAHLNANPKLLEGIGFRIPTQATSSLEFFTIKGFLPESLGSAIVVPSDITTKAGSDFDVDKLNTYLNNYRLDGKGLPIYEEFQTNNTVQERYDNVYGRKRKFLKHVERFLLKNYEKEILNAVNKGAASDFFDSIFENIDDVSFYSDAEIEEVLKESDLSNVDYQDLLKKVKEEEENSPTLDEFAKLPLHLQNTRGAVENAYFESIRNILKQPERYTQLLSINSMKNITEAKNAVNKAKNPSMDAKIKKLSYSNFLDINYLVSKRQAFAKGKFDIGIFAVAMTNFANSQVVGLGITEGTIKQRDQWIMDLNNDDISLPFAEIPVMNINGYRFISLSNNIDSDGKNIMDKISGYVNGAVDVAKEPDIVEMGMHTILADVYMLLEKAQLGGVKTALFLQQPIIREYLKELIYRKNPEFGYSPYNSMKEMTNSILEKYSAKTPYYKQVEYTEAQLIAMITKGEIIKKEQQLINIGETVKKPTQWTDSEKQMQYMALVNYLKMNMMAKNLFENIQGSNHDTSKMRSSWAIARKDMVANGALTEGNIVMAPTKGGYKPGVQALREDTFVQKTIDMYKLFNTIFSDINLFALQKDNPRNTLLNIAARSFEKDPFKSADDFEKMMKEYEVSLIDMLLNEKVYNEFDNSISSYTRQFFKPIEEVDGVMKNTNNIFIQFTNIKKDFPNFVKNNFFLSNLSIDLDQSIGVYTLDMKYMAKDDVLSRNLLIEGLREMHNHPNTTMRKFAETIEKAAIIQFGMKYQRKTITPFIPMEYYSQYSLAAFENIDNEDFSLFEEEVLRANSYRSGFVKENVPFSMALLNADGTVKTSWANRTDAEFKFNLPPKLSGRVYINRTEEIRPAFFWQKYMDDSDMANGDYSSFVKKLQPYIVVRMVRPEFVIKGWDEQRDLPKNELSKQVFTMIERKDFSWSYTQLFKLVGVDGTTPSVISKIKKNKGKHKGETQLSVLYKPINSFGAYNFNEVAKISADEEGNVTGKRSELKTHPLIKEQTDTEILETVGKIQNMSISLAQYNKVDFNQEDLFEQDSLSIPDTKNLNLKNKSKVIEKPVTSKDGTINIYAGSGENSSLSNFAIRPFDFNGSYYKSVEQAFQYLKSTFSTDTAENAKISEKILAISDGKSLRSLGRYFKGFRAKDWDLISPSLMKDLIRASFLQNEPAKDVLLSTGDAMITHRQEKGRWGTEFPRILMEVREELRPPDNTIGPDGKPPIELDDC